MRVRCGVRNSVGSEIFQTFGLRTALKLNRRRPSAGRRVAHLL